jgi:2-methylisocitrate lyase-like PEP mutase family enzyme
LIAVPCADAAGGLPDMDAIHAVVRAVAPRPVNVLIGPGVPLHDLAVAGVRRISLGGALYRRAMAGLAAAAEAMRAGDLPTAVRGAVPGAELAALLPSPGAD